MSFILDALRKSETERQRQSGPGLVDAGYRPPARRRGIWVPVLVAVLGANLVLLAALWLRRDPAPAAAPPVPAQTATVARPAEPAAIAEDPAKAAAGTTTDEEFAAIADMPAEDAEPAAASAFEPAANPSVETQSAPSAPPQPDSQHLTVDLPTAQQLAAEGTAGIPDLHLDIHVYSTTPAERFAFINMRRYTEGAQLAEGPRVEEITREGVVLGHAGRRFLLTRE